MTIILNLTKRHIKKFLRNRSALFFSVGLAIFPAVFLIVLGNATFISMIEMMAGTRELAWKIYSPNILTVSLSMMVLTVPTTILGFMPEDFENKVIENYLTAPIKRSQISLSYILSSVTVVFILSFIFLLVGELLLMLTSRTSYSFLSFMKVFGYLTIMNLTFTAVIFYVTSFFRTGQGAKGLNGLVNGIIPQISGIYFPLAMLPESFVSIINLLPFSHGISLLRKELVYTLITNHVSVPENIVELDSFFGGEVIIFGYELTQFHSIIILLTYALIFMFLGVQKFRNEKL